MTEREFIQSVGKLEDRQKKSPFLFKLWVVLVLLSGIFFLFGFLVSSFLLLIISYGCFVFSPIISIFTLTMGVMLLYYAIITIKRIIACRVAEPPGYALKREESPALFDKIDRISKQLKTPKIHKVLLDCQFNAAAVQRSRFGMLGGKINAIVIGLPLLFALDQEHMDAVLVHEMAHISKLHGSFNLWILRVYSSWMILLENKAFQELFGTTFIFRLLARWANRIQAALVVLRKTNELEAEKISSTLLGTKIILESKALTFYVCQYWEQEFLEGYYQKAAEHESVYPLAEYMADVFSERIPQDYLAYYHRILTNKRYEFGHSHPSYTELCDFLQAQADPPSMPETAALRVFFPDTSGFQQRFQKYWEKETGRAWRNHRRYFCNCRAKLDQLQAQKQKGSLNSYEMFLVAYYTEQLKGRAEALELYRQAYAQDPYQAGANYAIGMEELRNFDPAGVEKVRRSITKNIKYFTKGYSAIYDYYLSQNMNDEAESYKQSQENNRAEHENYIFYINNITQETYYSNLEIDEAVADGLKCLLKGAPLVWKAYLSKKTRYGDKEIYILVLKESPLIWRGRQKLRDDLADDIWEYMDSRDVGVIICDSTSLPKLFYRQFRKLFSICLK